MAYVQGLLQMLVEQQSEELGITPEDNPDLVQDLRDSVTSDLEQLGLLY